MHDYFAILGLAPGVYSQRELDARFAARRESLLQILRSADGALDAGPALDHLHLAYQALSDPDRQAALREELFLRHTRESASTDAAYDAQTLRTSRGDFTALRRLIADSLEDGLLRYSRRQQIITAARAQGLSDFETQLIIAQVQFGGIDVLLPTSAHASPTARAERNPTKLNASRGLALAGALGLTMAALAIAALR